MSFERIAFSDDVTGRAHGLHDVISNTVSSDIAEGAGEPASNRAVSSFQ